jgi:prepilin signal peptidase PulO-like enzyme (type II secretory pathway)
MYYAIVAICFCIAIAVVDLKTLRIPDVLLVSFALFLVIAEGSQPYMIIIGRLAAAMLSFFLFAIIWFHSKGVGFGDVKYAAVLGFLLGYERLVQAFFITAVLGIIIYLVGIILYRWPKTTKIPFAPFMSAGAIISITGGIQ